MLKNFILSQRAGKTRYLYSETATYIANGEEIKGSDMEDKRKQREKNCISGRLIE